MIESTPDKTQNKESLSEEEKKKIIQGISITDIKSFDRIAFERISGIFRLYDYIRYILKEEKSGFKWFKLDNEQIKLMQSYLFLIQNLN